MGGIFGSPQKPGSPSAPPPMPDMNDPAALEARRRRLAMEAGRQGRASTILSAGSGLGGGGSNNNTPGKTTLG